jgi:chemotaxis family two-component system sensor histidine kinase/response regulator PixL
MAGLAGMTILVVNPDEAFRQRVALVLRREGCTPILTPNGKTALDYLKTSTAPDLILLGILMPVMDGWAFLRHREQDPKLSAIPVVIVTGLVVASQQWAESLGANGLVKKTTEMEHLVEKCQEVLLEGS